MKNEWTNVGWLVKGVSGAATVFIGDEIFIIGGFNIESEEPNGDVQIFNVKTGKCRICEELRYYPDMTRMGWEGERRTEVGRNTYLKIKDF